MILYSRKTNETTFNFFIAFNFILLLIGGIGCDGSSTGAVASITFSGNHVSFSETSPQNVITGNIFSITVTPDSGFTLLSTVPGDCPTGSWNGNIYTTGAITENCTVIFSASASETTLAVGLSRLALATSGNARSITITNTGSSTAENLSINYPTWPSGTTASSS